MNDIGIGNAYIEMLGKVLSYGSICEPRGKEIKELLGVSFTGKCDKNQLLNFDYRNISDANTAEGGYLLAEIFWYMSGNKYVNFIGEYGSIWKNITNFDGSVNSNYGRSVFYKNAGKTKMSRYKRMIKAIKDDPDTRQAIISYTNNKIYDSDTKDFTCTQLQHFFVRNRVLHSIVYIRSSDMIYGLGYDIPWWSIVQQIAFLELKNEGIVDEIGNLTVNIGSAHIYKNHYELGNKLITDYNSKEIKCDFFKSLIVKDFYNFDFGTNENSVTNEKRYNANKLDSLVLYLPNKLLEDDITFYSKKEYVKNMVKAYFESIFEII